MYPAVLLCFALLTPQIALSSPAPVDDSSVVDAYGTIVDSIVVTGNRDTKSYIFVREMETRVGDILVWDNRSLIHSVNMDFPVGQRRLHQRILIKGARPV